MTPDSEPSETPEPSDGGSGPPTGRGRSDSLRVGIAFGVCIVGLYLLRWWEPIDLHVIEPFTLFIATLTRWTLGPFGGEVAQEGTIVAFDGVRLNILEECNGVPAIIVFVSAILAYPASIRLKAIGLALGMPAIFVVNQVRVLSLFFAHRFLSKQVFDLLHEYVWQFVIIIFSVLLWIYWAERFVRRDGAPDTTPQHP